MKSARIVFWLVAATAVAMGPVAVLSACLPADSRPTPGSLTVTVSPSPAVTDGVLTADGWALSFQRVLLGIGSASLSDTCVRYSDQNYDRLIDLNGGSGQKLSTIYGIGECDVRFRIGAPSQDALLGALASEDDKTTMRTPGSDPYVPVGGIAVDIAGRATREGITKQFHFVFRPRVRFRNCHFESDAGPAVKLESNDNLTYDLRVEAEAIFRDNATISLATLRFDPFAGADTNNDGTITFDELRQVPISIIRDAGAFETGTYIFDDDAGVTRGGTPLTIATLGDYVYIVLLPTLARFRDTGTCEGNISLGQGGRRN